MNDQEQKMNDDLNQKVPQAALQAAADQTEEILKILHAAGIDISSPDTPDGIDQFKRQLQERNVEFIKVLQAERPDLSGTSVRIAGIEVGFVPAVVAGGCIV